MKRLLTLDEKNYPESFPVHERFNVRGVILRDGMLAMERSRMGEYKFPGGGVDPGEELEAALCREVQEETGLVVIPSSIRPFGEIYEKRLDIYTKDSIYLCHSLYYTCEVEERTVEPDRTESEIRQGYVLSWATPDEIMQSNQCFAQKKWISRDTTFLKLWLEGAVR